MPYKPKSNLKDYQRKTERTEEYKGRYDSAWRKYRAWYLRQHPLCEDCLRYHGRATPATEVHHIIALRDGGEKMDESNVQGLCKQCHSRETGSGR